MPGFVVGSVSIAGHDGKFPAKAVGVSGYPATFAGLTEAAIEEVLAVIGKINGGAKIVFAAAGAGYALLIGSMAGDSAHVEAVLVFVVPEGADDLNV